MSFKYETIYSKIKTQIIDGSLPYGTKLMPIRQAAKIYNVSITTIETAYFRLASDGYIVSKPQSGYFSNYKPTTHPTDIKKQDNSDVRYNFTLQTADSESFNFTIWKRYMKAALKNDEKLLSYSSPKGESELRTAIADYVSRRRNVSADPEHIVIGAGTYALLNIICSLLDTKSNVSLPTKKFSQAAAVFDSYGFDITYRNIDASVIYVSPAHMTHTGDVMPTGRRQELVQHSVSNNQLIIEDDYDSDFIYNTHPSPALYTLAGGENVVYIGSFSRLLLPSIRISYMILTNNLIRKFEENDDCYSQTASKTEQLALAQYIRDGCLTSQSNKTRRFYTTKTRDFCNLLKANFPDAQIETSDNNLQIIMSIPFGGNIECFKQHNISVNIEHYDNKTITFSMNTFSIKRSDFQPAVTALKCAINISNIKPHYSKN